MFTALQTLLASLSSLTLSLVANADNTITVTVFPKGGKGSGSLDTPLTLTGTAAELDAGFAEILSSFTNKRQSLSDQLAATEAILEAAQKEATDKAKKSIAKPAKNSSAPTAGNSEGSNDDVQPEDGDDELGASGTASASTAPATPPAAEKSASDVWS